MSKENNKQKKFVTIDDLAKEQNISGLSEMQVLPAKREVHWLGNSLANHKEFRGEVQNSLGNKLLVIQYGGVPTDTKPLTEFGSGVFEIASRYGTNTYRLVVAIKLGDLIYVLHAFQKKSKHGIAIPRNDSDLIKQRYREAQELAKRI